MIGHKSLRLLPKKKKNLWSSSIQVLINLQRGNLSSLNKCVFSALSSENLKISDINLSWNLHFSLLRGMMFHAGTWMPPGTLFLVSDIHPNSFLPISTSSFSILGGSRWTVQVFKSLSGSSSWEWVCAMWPGRPILFPMALGGTQLGTSTDVSEGLWVGH